MIQEMASGSAGRRPAARSSSSRGRCPGGGVPGAPGIDNELGEAGTLDDDHRSLSRFANISFLDVSLGHHHINDQNWPISPISDSNARHNTLGPAR